MSVAVRPVALRLEPSTAPKFVIRLKITNLTQTAAFDFRHWEVMSFHNEFAKCVDDTGEEYLPQLFLRDNWPDDDESIQGPIEPGKSIHVTLAWLPPSDSAKTMQVELDAVPVGGKPGEKIALKVTAEQWKTAE